MSDDEPKIPMGYETVAMGEGEDHTNRVSFDAISEAATRRLDANMVDELHAEQAPTAVGEDQLSFFCVVSEHGTLQVPDSLRDVVRPGDQLFVLAKKL